MGLIRTFLDASVAAKVTVCALLLANVFNWIVFCMNDWGLMDTEITNVDDEQGFGVWVLCGRTSVPDCRDLDGWRLAWYGAFQGFMVFGFVSVNLAFLFIVLGVFVPQCIGNRDTFMFCFIACIVGALTYLISCIIFGVHFDETYDRNFDEEELYVCFDMAVVNIFILIASAIAAIIAFLNPANSVANEGGSSAGDEMGRRRRMEQEEEDRRKKEQEKENKRKQQEEKMNRQNEEEEKRRKDEEKKRAAEQQQQGLDVEQGAQRSATAPPDSP